MRNSGETRFPKSPLTYRAVFLDGETALGAGDHKNIRPRLINVSKAFIMRGGKRPDRKTHVLAVKGSVFAELRRRRRRYVSPNCAQTRKLRLKANYQVSTQKNGNFQENLKIPKIGAIYGTRANFKVSQNHIDLGKFFSCSNLSVEECC